MSHEHFQLRLRERFLPSVFLEYHLERLKTAQHAQPDTAVFQKTLTVQFVQMEQQVQLDQRSAKHAMMVTLQLRYSLC